MQNVKLPRLSKKQSNVRVFSFKNRMTPHTPFLTYFIDRVQRLKDARSEAAKDIEELKTQKNTEYQNFVSQVSLQTDNCFICFFLNIHFIT
jgi:hypothetical protein